MNKHENSREVTIFRTRSFLEQSQGAEAAEYMQAAKVSVGSYYVSKDSAKVASGLNFNEERLLLPEVLEVPADHPDFRKKVSEYYVNITTDIPAKHGRKLEIGLLKSNDKPVSIDNMPIALGDYLRWRHAREHPFMAKDRTEGSSNMLKQYYLFNPYEIKARQISENDDKDAALQIFFAIKNESKTNKEMMDMMLTLLGEDPRVFTGKNAVKDKEDVLRSKALEDPERFAKVYEQGDLEERAWIKTLVNTGVLKVLLGKYVDPETKIAIANSDEEMLFWFKEPENSAEVGMLKARAQEKLLEPVKPNARKTQAKPNKQLSATLRN
jgi:hypothetical protein